MEYDMSTAALTNLRNYLTSTLSTSDMIWLMKEMKDFMRDSVENQKPYTMEEINSRISQAERESAAGLGQDSEEMFRELEEEFAREELEMSVAI